MAARTLAGPDTPVWKELEASAARLATVATRELVQGDPKRFERFSAEAAGLLLDYTRQRVDEPTMTQLAALADAVRLRDRIEAMWRGDHINATEDRAVLHVALRQPAGAGIGGAEVEKLVLAERERMLSFAEGVLSGAIGGSTKKPFTLVVNIGIGGSDLGPAMAVEALREYSARGPRCAFVSNVDGCGLHDVLESANPENTLFIVASKTFTTLETLTNARTARAWLAKTLGEKAVPEHFAAVSVNHTAMNEFGVHPDYRFQMWDWVGGRYSMWSSIGVTLAIAIGRANFMQFLRGGHEMDQHFRSAPWRQNLPALMGLLGIWNIDFRHLPTLAVLPYDDRLKRLPAYLQQLEMESNGKSVRLDGSPVGCETAAVIWGEPGNNAQHSFFQLLHQGTPRAALDFLLPAKSSCSNQPQQDLAIANCLAQAEAFMAGNPPAAVRAELERMNLPAERVQYLVPQKVHPGDRPSSIIGFEKLDPATLGRLVALYEHKVFTQGVVWGINSFDQWGVELGKKLASELAPAVRDPAGAQSVAPGVARLLRKIDEWRRNS
ncbi:MAG TPA: glucose-6-phosphate isomerase [Steroidobacteraceae bacterium]|nr:glucose-6-phosphate isomerase [Steroidobacteraceae bacterium]